MKRAITIFLIALLAVTAIFPFADTAFAATSQVSGIVEVADASLDADYCLKLDSIDGIPSLYASGVANSRLELFGYKIDFAAYVGKRVAVSSTIDKAFYPTRNGLGYEITTITLVDDINDGTATQKKNAAIEEANRVLSTLNSRHDLKDWFVSYQSMVEHAMIHWCGGESVPASKIDGNLRRYFGVETVDHSALKFSGAFSYSNGYYAVAASGWAEYDWANIKSYTENSDGSITAQVNLYAAPIEVYDSKGRYVGEGVENFDDWYYKDVSEWPYTHQSYIYDSCEAVLKPFVNGSTQTWQVVSIDGIKVPSAASKPSSWAQASIDKAITLGLATADLTNGYQTATTRAEFCRAAVNFLRKYGYDVDGVTPKMFEDTSDKDIGIAAALKITSGTNAAGTEFTPNRAPTREEAATMLRNVMNVIGAKYDTTAVKWTDAKDVSSWAAEAANVMYNAKVMGGTSTTALVFSPKSSYTHEASITTLVNLWEYVKK